MYFQKYAKYKIKNEKIVKGSGLGSVFSVASKIAKGVDVAKKTVESGAEKVIIMANKASESLKKIEKEIEKDQKTIIEVTDKDTYNKLSKSINSLAQILSSKSALEIINKKTEILKLINSINEIIKKSKIKQSDKDSIQEIVNLINIMFG